MNFEEAITAHLEWKHKLKDYISQPDKSLTPQIAARVDECEFGKWIKGEGARYRENPVFKELINEHQKFHLAASEIIKRADEGQNVSEEFYIGALSDFGLHAQKVVALLKECKREYEQ